jgi:hypothetical protein
MNQELTNMGKTILALGVMSILFLPLLAWGEIHVPRNRAVILPVGPFVDFTDGVTPELALTATNITCTLARRSDAGGAGVNPTLVINTTLTAAGGTNDLVLLAGSTTGLYGLELTAAQLATAGSYVLSLSDPDVMCPWWIQLVVDPNRVYDSLGSGTDTLDVALGAEDIEDIAAGVAAGIGNVTVGDLTAAALAKFASQDTGETEVVAGSVAALSRNPLAGGSVFGGVFGN